MAYEAKHYKTTSESRSYEGYYLNRQNERRKVRVKIANRVRFAKMAGLFAATIFIQGVIVGPAVMEAVNNIRGIEPKSSQEIVVLDQTPLKELSRNKNQIQYIIDNNPHILKDASIMNYEVEYGDSLGYLAEKTGNTIGRICELNNLNRNDMLYQGQNIKLEVLQDKSELDKEVACIESYYEDYLLKSQTAQECFNQFFGTSNSNTIDSRSVQGRYILESANFRDKLNTPGIEVTDQDKRDYVERLMSLERETANVVNRGNVENMTPYSKYKIYLENGTTEYEELKDNIHSIYG